MIIIRNPVKNEIPKMVKILFESFNEFSQIFGNHEIEGQRLFSNHILQNEDNLKKYLVAVEGDRVIGMMSIKKNKTKEQINISIQKIFKIFGIVRTIKIILGFYTLDSQKFNSNSYYVDYIAISPEARGEGVGTLLIQELFKIAEKNNMPIISSRVLEKNHNAVKLYKRLGFVKIKKERKLLESFIIKTGSSYYMERKNIF